MLENCFNPRHIAPGGWHTPWAALGPVNTYFALALGRKEVSYKARNAGNNRL
ncbi:hypothetical protein SAMN02745857_03631, partial [Andreprevotia lacus DSM 23236]